MLRNSNRCLGLDNNSRNQAGKSPQGQEMTQASQQITSIYLIGAPGVGKTTLINYLIADWDITGFSKTPISHTLYRLPDGRTATQLGVAKPPFGGTDTLSFTVIEKATQWLPDTHILLAEGDRLANPRYLTYLQETTNLNLFHLKAPQTTLTARRTQRATKHNLPEQNTQWANSRATKHAKLAEQFNATTLDATLKPEQLAQIVFSCLQ